MGHPTNAGPSSLGLESDNPNELYPSDPPSGGGIHLQTNSSRGIVKAIEVVVGMELAWGNRPRRSVKMMAPSSSANAQRRLSIRDISPNDVRDRQSPKLRLNGMCAYYTMFPLTFPYHHLSGDRTFDWVLDPFCGRGTTNLAARLLSRPSVGTDSSPVASAIASAKLCDVGPDSVVAVCRRILEEARAPRMPRGEFWSLCYHHETLQEICQIREELLRDSQSEPRKVLRALMLGVLHGPLRKGLPAYLSNQMPRTYATKPGSAVRYWHKHNLAAPRIPVLELIERRAPFYLSTRLPRARGCILRRDSRRRLPDKFSGLFGRIVTSPPYLGMNQYLKDQWLRNWFVGGPSRPLLDSSPRIRSEDKDVFISDLSKVWTAVAESCMRRARMTIRFGSLPSLEVDPLILIKESLDASNACWRILTVTDAGTALGGKRQSGQFTSLVGKPLNEVDVHAILEAN